MATNLLRISAYTEHKNRQGQQHTKHMAVKSNIYSLDIRRMTMLRYGGLCPYNEFQKWGKFNTGYKLISNSVPNFLHQFHTYCI